MQKTQFGSLGQEAGRRKWKPTPVLLPGEFHGQRSRVDHSPWGHKESDTTERHTFHFHFFHDNMYLLFLYLIHYFSQIFQ